MTLRIAQSATPVDETHWRWSVWLDASSDELDDVKEVVWKLHPSFSPPVVRVTSRKDGFRLRSRGWGEFELHADVVRSDGQVEQLRHWLRFVKNPRARTKSQADDRAIESPAVAAPKIARARPALFLSYTSADARLAGVLARMLKERDVDVFVDVEIPAGEDFRRWTGERISESDAIVVLVPDDSSSHAAYEVGLAAAAGVLVIPVVTADHPMKVPFFLDSYEAIHTKGGAPEMIAPYLAERIAEIVGRRSI
jgi:hypothetical protein